MRSFIFLVAAGLIQWAHYGFLTKIYPPRFKQVRLSIFLVLNTVPVIQMAWTLYPWSRSEWPIWFWDALSLYIVFMLVSLGFVIWQTCALIFFRLKNRKEQKIAVEKAAEADAVIDEDNQNHSAMPRRDFLAQQTRNFFIVASVGGGAGALKAFDRLSVNRLNLEFENLPSDFDGMTIAHLSDIHSGFWVGEKRLKYIADFVAGYHPDVIVFTGDQFDLAASDIPQFVSAFKHLKSKIATLGILGNHDYMAGRTHSIQGLKAAGITPLVNDSFILSEMNQKIAFVGLEDLWATRFRGGRPPNIQQAMHQIPEVDFKICLSHQPKTAAMCFEAGMDLVLSGHTHGGQFAIPWAPKANLAQITHPYSGGLYHKGDQKIVVSRGMGVFGLPARIGTEPELVFITLRKKRSA